MAADAEIHILRIQIAHVENNVQRVAVQAHFHIKPEAIGVLRARSFAVRKRKYDSIRALLRHLKIGCARKAVRSQVVFLAEQFVFALRQARHIGKDRGRTAAPIGGIALP